jgi:O-antigen ligase
VDRQYPHNLLLEVTLEAGWLAGACTLAILAAALGAAWAVSNLLEGRILLAGLGFWIINALVSGDVNDNRPLFTLVSASLALWKPRGGGP